MSDIPWEKHLRLQELLKGIDYYAKNSTGYQPDKGMFWFTVEKITPLLDEIHEIRRELLKLPPKGLGYETRISAILDSFVRL